MREKPCRAHKSLDSLWREEKMDLSPQARSHRYGSPRAPRTCSFALERAQQRETGMDNENVARVDPCGCVWGRSQGAKGSVLMGLGALIICHLSWEEPTCDFALPQPRWSSRGEPRWSSRGVHCEDGERVKYDADDRLLAWWAV